MNAKTRLAMVLAVSAAAWLGDGCVIVPERSHAVIVSEGPPPPPVEVVPAAPGPQYVWVQGYWGWHDRWVWQPGHHVLRPHAHAIYVPGRWYRGHRGWVWEPGRWR